MTRLQLTIDCHDADRLVPFWCRALGYRPMPPPPGFETWRDWYLSVGVPEEELGEGPCQDRIEDPAGVGPLIWFQPVPEAKTVKNRVHLDLKITGGRTEPVELRAPVVEAKVAELVTAGATKLRLLDGVSGHYAWVMQDPEGNEFCVA